MTADECTINVRLPKPFFLFWFVADVLFNTKQMFNLAYEATQYSRGTSRFNSNNLGDVHGFPVMGWLEESVRAARCNTTKLKIKKGALKKNDGVWKQVTQ